MPDNTPHLPTEISRAEVSALVSFGIKHEDIARHLRIHFNTLTKYYRHELDTAVTQANSIVANKLFKKATEGDDLSAMIFWLKTRARWRERDPEEKFNVVITTHEDALKELK